MRARLRVRGTRWKVLLGTLSAVALLFGVAWNSGAPALASVAKAPSFIPASQGELDCNGFSPAQKPLREMNCTDIAAAKKTNANTWGGRFYDNGHYIGHDEPDIGLHVQRPGLRQQRDLDDHPRPRPEGGADRRQPGP